jgi:hypothetical protein
MFFGLSVALAGLRVAPDLGSTGLTPCAIDFVLSGLVVDPRRHSARSSVDNLVLSELVVDLLKHRGSRPAHDRPSGHNRFATGESWCDNNSHDRIELGNQGNRLKNIWLSEQ